MPDTHAPDVSEFQPNVDWPQVVAHNGGAAIIRAHNGWRVDNCWYGGARRSAAHVAGCRVLGLYQYLPASVDPVQAARAFAAAVGALQPGEFAVLDLEEGDGDQLARAQAWLDECDRLLTYPGYHGAWLYSGASFYHDHNLMPVANSARHTWVAAYGQGEPTDVPHTLWQHSSSEAWPGIGACDCSIFHGDVAALEAKVWTGAAAHPADPVPQPVVHVTPTPARPIFRPVPTQSQEDGMSRLIQVQGDPAIYATDGLTRRWVENPTALAELKAAGVFGDGSVHPVSEPTLAWLPLEGPAPK